MMTSANFSLAGLVHRVTAPLVEPLLPAPEADEVFRRLTRRRHCVFFDSALRHSALGRYSFVAAEPFDFLRLSADAPDAFGALADKMAAFDSDTLPDLPPFQGGAAGLFSYDLNRQLERLPAPRMDPFQIPALAVGLYDVVFAFDHSQGEAWIISQGWPETDPRRRARRAGERMVEARSWLTDPAPYVATRQDGSTTASELQPARMGPRYATTALDGLTSNFSEDSYLRAVGRVIEYIHAGDVFQVNLAQQLLLPARDDSVSLYGRLRERNPAPFAGYFDLGDFQIASASPERFLSVVDGEVEARPIKGTRARGSHPEADLYAAADLLQSEKDRAENVMIVDLLRNDLSRACRADSVQVTQLCELETYRYVQHLVSAVRGRLRDDSGALDLLRGAFPGGSITGAPKVRAMQIIAELEPTARGAYCGCLGYLGFDGSLDTSILIRTVTAGRGWWQAPVGGGIVAQSIPGREYEETWHKAAGLLRAFPA